MLRLVSPVHQIQLHGKTHDTSGKVPEAGPHCKNTSVTLTTLLGCLSCINVTNKQIGKASLVTLVSEDLFGYIPATSTTNRANKELRA